MGAIHDETNSLISSLLTFVSIVLDELSQTFEEVCRGSNYKCVLEQVLCLSVHLPLNSIDSHTPKQ
jgi:hypothetical protein